MFFERKKFSIALPENRNRNTCVTTYWTVDPEKEHATVYRYDEKVAPMIFSFNQTIQVGIYKSAGT